jgi:hypothetical protein
MWQLPTQQLIQPHKLMKFYTVTHHVTLLKTLLNEIKEVTFNIALTGKCDSTYSAILLPPSSRFMGLLLFPKCV